MHRFQVNKNFLFVNPWTKGEGCRILATGGASNNKAILQVMSDVFNADVYIQVCYIGIRPRSIKVLYLFYLWYWRKRRILPASDRLTEQPTDWLSKKLEILFRSTSLLVNVDPRSAFFANQETKRLRFD